MSFICLQVPTKRKTRQGTSRRGAQRENDIEIKVPLSDVPSSVRTPQQKRKKANLVQNPNEKVGCRYAVLIVSQTFSSHNSRNCCKPRHVWIIGNEEVFFVLR